ncbi:hypothetical protein [Roseateles sp. BYS87W]|uniref:Uncharacterized protein n=1 Tax=Pelomonas baiyunensis TaxID=3299026 RepID=A0ABW7GW54_9BURK
MKPLDDTTDLFSPPPLWLCVLTGAVLGAALMWAFIDTLHENVRHGEAFRQGQRAQSVQAAALRQAVATGSTPTMGTSMSPNFVR